MAGPIDFHPGCFEGVSLVAGDSGETGGEEERPSMANISSDTLFDIGMGTGSSRIGLRR